MKMSSSNVAPESDVSKRETSKIDHSKDKPTENDSPNSSISVPGTMSARDLIAQSLKLPCGLTLPNRLVKCPMQETLATGPFFDPPIEYFSKLYDIWGRSAYGLIITGQVQVDSRFLSIKGDVVAHAQSLQPGHFEKWQQWAAVSKRHGTPCIVQLAHPGRRSPAGAGNRPADMQTLCPSSVPMNMGTSWLDAFVSCMQTDIPMQRLTSARRRLLTSSARRKK
jgi:hypothetical protein